MFYFIKILFTLSNASNALVFMCTWVCNLTAFPTIKANLCISKECLSVWLNYGLNYLKQRVNKNKWINLSLNMIIFEIDSVFISVSGK